MENLQSDHLDTQNLYRDMQKRTGGEIYIGVVGPVRTGKSTFIKRFMDVAVLPYMEDAAQKTRAQDELPRSAQARRTDHDDGAEIYPAGGGRVKACGARLRSVLVWWTA